MSDSYVSFAGVYDSLIGQDYGKIADFMEDIFKRHGLSPSLVLDLACGTGSLTMELAQRGYDMLGIDLSENMLSVALDKSIAAGYDIRYLCQDMTQFELYGTVDCIVCTLDAVNYVTDKRRLLRLFRLVDNYLNPNGLFIFDINTEYKLKNVLGGNTFVADSNEIFYTWENYFDGKSGISSQLLTFFCREENGLYKRFDEEHFQRAYSENEITTLLKRAHLDTLEILDWLKNKRPCKNAEKIVFVSKKIC